MTKTIKKSLLAVLLFVMAIACSFSVSSFTASAATETKDQQKAAFSAQLSAFTTIADTDGVAGLSEDEIKVAMSNKNANNAFTAMYTRAISGNAIADADKAVYDGIFAIYNANKAVDLYSGIKSTAYNVANKVKEDGTGVKYSYKHHEQIEALRDSFDAIKVANAEDYAFIINSDLVLADNGEPKNLVDAEARIKGWKDDINAAISAIQDIDVTVDGNNLTNVYDGADYLANYDVVIESYGSIDLAEKAIAKVNANDDAEYIKDHVGVATSARAEYDEQGKIVDEMQKAIKALYEGVYKYNEKAYTIKGDAAATNVNVNTINGLSNAYESLNGGDLSADTALNRLYDTVKDSQYKDGVTYADLVSEMLGEVARVTTLIGNVNDAIDAIGELSYTKAISDKIDDAREIYDTLPADVKENNVDVEYSVLDAAEKQWQVYCDEITALKEAVVALTKTEAIELFDAIGKVTDEYAALSDVTNQLTGDNGNLEGFTLSAFDLDDDQVNDEFNPMEKGEPVYTAPLTTFGQLYDHFSELANSIATATTTINNNMEDLLDMDVRFSATFDAAFNVVDNAIAQLPKDEEGNLDARYAGAIVGYTAFLEMKADRKALHDAASELFVVLDKFTLDNNDKVVFCTKDYENAVATKKEYADIVALYVAEGLDGDKLASDLAVYSKASSDATGANTYAEYYAIYTSALAGETALNGAISALDAAAKALAQRPDLGGDYNKYSTAITAVTMKYNNLHCDDCREYFQENNEEAYNAYVKALVYDKAHAIETAILKIFAQYDSNAVAGNDYNFIAKARNAYDTVLGEEGLYTKAEIQAEVRNYKVGAQNLVDVEDELQDWEDAIEAMLKGAGFSVDGVRADLIAADVIAQASKAANKDNIKDGFYYFDVDAALTLIESVKGWGVVKQSYVYKVVDVADYNIMATAELLTAMMEIAGTKIQTQGELGIKLAYIDNELAKYVDAYGKGQAETGVYEVLEELTNALHGKQLLLLKNLEEFQQIARDKAMADELAAAIDALYDDVNAGQVTADTTVNYYIICSIYEGLNSSQKALVVTTGATAQDKLVAIEAKLDDVSSYDLTAILARLTALEGTYSDAKIDELIKKAVEATYSDAKIDELIAAVKDDLSTAISKNVKKLKELIEANTKLILTIKNDVAYAFAYADGLLKDELMVEINALCKQIANAKKDLEDADKAINTAITTLRADMEGADIIINELIDALEAADVVINADIDALEVADAEINAAIAQLRADMEAADDAIKAELKANVEALNQTILIITIIFSVIMVGMIACIVVLFVKRKA